MRRKPSSLTLVITCNCINCNLTINFLLIIFTRMSRFWTFLNFLHSMAGPGVMLLYPLYASVVAIESTSKVDDEQWLAYWILYSFLTLMEMLLYSVLEWVPIWYDLKLAFVAWLVLPQFRGAAFIYEKFVREKVIKKYGGLHIQKFQGKD